MKGILSIGSILIFSLLFFSCEKQDIDRMDKQIIELEKNLTERGLRVSKDLYENEYDIILDDNKYLEILITLDDGNLLFLDRLILEIKFEQGQSVDVEFPSFEKVMQPNGLVKINKYTITKNVASINEYQQIRDSIDQSLGIPKNLDTINAKDSLENLILNKYRDKFILK